MSAESENKKAVVVGAGLAGLATAVRLVDAGLSVRVFEATDHAGGRCRSFYDRKLGRMIDNGNHLVLTGNRSVAAYLAEIDASDRLIAAREAVLPFVDISSDLRWRIAMNDGLAPWWVLSPSRRAPDTSVSDYLSGVGLALAKPGATVAEAIRARGPIWDRFWEPMTLAVLNTTPERGSAQLLWAVLWETFARGGAQARPMFAPEGLGTALVEPAVAKLAQSGAPIRYGAALRGIEIVDERVARLQFDEEDIAVDADETVVLALPPSRLRNVAPFVDAPEDLAAIVNAHFTLEDPSLLANAPAILGVLGSKTHWIFVRDGMASLTISAADALGVSEAPSDELLPLLWAETRDALGLPARTQPAAGRILREKRATFDQSPAGVRRRPAARTELANLVLAGDATDTGLPATIEGAVRSGHRAAALVQSKHA